MTAAIPDHIRALLDQATSEGVRFIRLGRGGAWWPECKATGTLRLGYFEAPFALCVAGKWKEIAADFKKRGIGKTDGARTRHINQITEFYTLPEAVLWLTLADGDLWWCFAEREVKDLEPGDKEETDRHGARSRKIIGQWFNTDLEGNRLRMDTLTTWIVQTQAFQGTISRMQGADDALRRVRCQYSQTYTSLKGATEELTHLVAAHLHKLHEKDFELLIELIFSASGWRRISPVGGEQKTIDMALELPTSGERCFVQVKSQTSRAQFSAYEDQFSRLTGYSRMFYCYHSLGPVRRPGAGKLVAADSSRVTVWSADEIAAQVMNAGLVSWLLDKTT